MDFNSIFDVINKNILKKYDDMGKYSNLSINHSMLNGKIKEISLKFIPEDKKIQYLGYEMTNPGVLDVYVDLNTDISCDNDGENSDCMRDSANFIGLDPWQFINNVIYPYIEKKYLKLINIRIHEFPFVNFIVRNSQKQTLFYDNRDLNDFRLSKNPIIWKKVD